jgi:hypothetical protein
MALPVQRAVRRTGFRGTEEDCRTPRIRPACRFARGKRGVAGRSLSSRASPGYHTCSRKSPDAGAVRRAGAADDSAMKVEAAEGSRPPRPISTRTPTTRRTIFQRKCDPSMPTRSRSPEARRFSRSTSTRVDRTDGSADCRSARRDLPRVRSCGGSSSDAEKE